MIRIGRPLKVAYINGLPHPHQIPKSEMDQKRIMIFDDDDVMMMIDMQT
jgi:hypothetical protein